MKFKMSGRGHDSDGMAVCARRLILVCICVLMTVAPLSAGEPQSFDRQGPFPCAYPATLFAAAIEAAASVEPLPYTLSGLILPHHLLAADLIARTFSSARKREYRRVIILSPDHFNRGRTPFSVPGRDFLTSLGTAFLDREGTAALLRNGMVSESNLFSHEHGVQALLPFLVHHFPDALVLPVAIGRDSKPDEWRSLSRSLEPLLDAGTLLIQSTDFSHYLNREQTARRDGESIAVLLSHAPERVLSLRQPQNIDSRGALFVQMTLQKSIGSVPVLLGHVSSFEYNAAEAEKAGGTSYITAAYRRRDNCAPLSIRPSVESV